MKYKHDLSSDKVFSCNMGQLIPIGIKEVLPGDIFKHSTSAFIRLSPLLAPIMSRCEIRIHHWFVPDRLVYDEYEPFFTGSSDSIAGWPNITLITANHAVNSLADYYGLPPFTGNLNVSAIPFRGYNLIWNQHYRDEQLQTEAAIDTAGGLDTTTEVETRDVCWEKDYFTAARPDPQLGDEVLVPLTGEAPVLGIGKQNSTFGAAGATYRESDGTTSVYAASSTIDPVGANSTYGVEANPASSTWPYIRAELESATASGTTPGLSIRDLRETAAIQQFLENTNRSGGRYPEFLKRWGVRCSDARLGIPEYLGGGKGVVQFSEVLQTAPYDIGGPDESPVGSLLGHGTSGVRTKPYLRYFEEHGFVHTFISIKPKTMYTQGVERFWNRQTRLDYFNPEFAHVGMQPIYQREIYAQSATPTAIFGYTDKDDDYRMGVSNVSGEFRTTLDYWHMARIFSSEPALNSSFVQSTPTNRIFADQTSHQLRITCFHTLHSKRLVPPTGKPGMTRI